MCRLVWFRTLVLDSYVSFPLARSLSVLTTTTSVGASAVAPVDVRLEKVVTLDLCQIQILRRGCAARSIGHRVRKAKSDVADVSTRSSGNSSSASYYCKWSKLSAGEVITEYSCRDEINQKSDKLNGAIHALPWSSARDWRADVRHGIMELLLSSTERKPAFESLRSQTPVGMKLCSRPQKFAVAVA